MINSCLNRGRIAKDNTSDLYITSLPTGSFGVELTQLNTTELFDEARVGDAIQQVMRMIEEVTDTSHTLTQIFENVPIRNINNLTKFLKQISDENSMIKMESGSFHIEIANEKIKESYTRLSSLERKEETLILNGTLRGIFLESGKFEVVDENGNKYGGYLTPDIEESIYIHFLNQPAVIKIIKTTTTFEGEQRKVEFDLVEITDQKQVLGNILE